MVAALIIFIITAVFICSVANLIVAQQARRRVEIGFMEYFRAGAVITVITMAVGILILVVEVKVSRGGDEGAVFSSQRGTITIRSTGPASAEMIFRVALLCDTVEKRAKGLQGFRRLRKDEAALFVFETPEPATFWMGSVAYPIDIIFVGPAGNVVRSYPGCRPGSRELYQSGGAVKWVVETAAGSGIKAGDRVVLR